MSLCLLHTRGSQSQLLADLADLAFEVCPLMSGRGNLVAYKQNFNCFYDTGVSSLFLYSESTKLICRTTDPILRK